MVHVQQNNVAVWAVCILCILGLSSSARTKKAQDALSADSSSLVDMSSDSASILDLEKPPTPQQLTEESLGYICINQAGLQFQEIHQRLDLPRIGDATKYWGKWHYKLNVPWNMSEQSLTAALNTRWTLQASLRNAKEAKEDKEAIKAMEKDLEIAKNAIKSWGFSVKQAQVYCAKKNQQPKVEKIRECTTDFAKDGKTATRQPWYKPKLYKRSAQAWYKHSPAFRRSLTDIVKLEPDKARRAVAQLCFTSKGERTAKCLKKGEDTEAIELIAHAEKGDLIWHIKQTWFHEDVDELLATLGSKLFKEQEDVFNAIQRAKAESARAKLILKEAFSFSLSHTKTMCNELYESESTTHAADILEQIKHETNDPVKKDKLAIANLPGGKCVQKTDDSYCPEGMSGRLRRKDIDYQAAITTYFIGAATWGNPLAIAILGTAGFIAGGPAGAGAGVAIAVGTPTEWFLPIPAAIWVAVDFFPKCRCNLNPCELDAATDTCAMTPSGNSQNPYEWLPYPGMKCAPAKADPTKCIAQACDAEDYLWQNYADPMKDVLGLVGVHQKPAQKAGAYNCLKVAGTPLALMHEVQMKEWMKEVVAANSTALPRDVPKQGSTPAIVSHRNALFDKLSPPTASQPNILDESDPTHIELVQDAEEVGEHNQPAQLVNLISDSTSDTVETSAAESEAQGGDTGELKGKVVQRL